MIQQLPSVEQKKCLHCHLIVQNPVRVELKGLIFYFCGLVHAGEYIKNLGLSSQQERPATTWHPGPQETK